MIEHQLKGEYIELIKLLKYLNIASSGGEAKMLVDEGEVYLNGNPESRKRAKLKVGDIIKVQGKTIKVV